MRPISLMTVILLLAAAAAGFAQTPNVAAPLPPAIKTAFEQAYPGATIVTTSQTKDAGQAVFRIVSVDRGRSRVVLYEPGGKVVEVAEQVEEKDLPKPVAAAMHSHPRAIYVSGMKVTRGGNVEYRLTVRGTRKTTMVAKPDGTVVSFQ
jgi:acyl-coenzyme A synthetase/AMP-(fatty) acid ligase